MSFVYALADPIEPTHVRYVGMAQSIARPYSHAKIARKGVTSYLYNWVRKIQLDGRDPMVMILEDLGEHASPQLLGFVERCYIESLRGIGHKLTNTAEGGRGGKTVFGEEAIQHQRAALKKSWEDDKRRDAAAQRAHLLNTIGKIGFRKGHTVCVGRLCSDETKAKQRASLAKSWTPAARDKARQATLEGYRTNPERRLKIKEARAHQVMQPASEETRRKLSASWTDDRRANNPNIGRVRPQEERDRISQSKKGWKPSEETRANMRVAAQLRESLKRQRKQEGELK